MMEGSYTGFNGGGGEWDQKKLLEKPRDPFYVKIYQITWGPFLVENLTFNKGRLLQVKI